MILVGSNRLNFLNSLICGLSFKQLSALSLLTYAVYIFTPLKLLYPDPRDLPPLEWNSDRGNQASDAGRQHGTRPVAARQDQSLYQESRICEMVLTVHVYTLYTYTCTCMHQVCITLVSHYGEAR